MLPDFRIRQRDYLLETTRALTEELDLRKVLASIAQISAELLAGRASLIALREQGDWQIASSHGIRADFLKRVQRLLADIPAQPDSTRFELPEVTSRLQRITESASLGLLSSVGLPLVARGEIIGVIFVFRAYRSAFTRQDRELLQAFASQAAIAVHNARLYTELAEQKQFLDAVIDSSADGIFLLDSDLRFVHFNRACTHMTGYPQADVLGSDHADFLQFEELRAGETLESERKLGWPERERRSLYVEGELRQQDGGKISVGISYAPVFSMDGHLMSVVGNIRDITRFREAEELKDTFISVISHELRTPVALIKGYVGTLRRKDAQWDPDVVRDSLAVIEDEADHLGHLIDDLLDASRLRAGVLELNMGEVEVLPMIERLVSRFQTQTDVHTFEIEVPPEFPVIHADEARLSQVVSNLISNAIKFADGGGAIKLSAGADAEEISICVEDQGPGIAPRDVSHVFDRFYRSSEAERGAPGTGLGLYLARAVIEAHGGRIWVDEQIEHGARICFSLPRN